MTLTAEQERPIKGAAPEGWCENYALVANDPLAEVNVCYYTGSQPFDSSLWQEILLIALPRGRVLTWKSAGRGGSEKGSGGALTRFLCEEPGARWRLQFSGLGRLVEIASLAEATVADGPWTPASLDLVFDALGPPWVLGEDTLEHAHETSRFHYEQAGRVRGSVVVGGESFTLDGSGNRDHSRGPRDFLSVLDHAWVNAAFEDGRWLTLYRMRLADGSDGVAVACLGDADSATRCAVKAMPLLAETDRRDGYEIVLEADGAEHRIDVKVLHSVGTVSYMTPNHMAIGASSAPEATQIVSESASLFLFDGVVGHGHTQRSEAPAHRS